MPDAGVRCHAPGSVTDGEDVGDDFVGRDVAVCFEEAARGLADGVDVFLVPGDFFSWGWWTLSWVRFFAGSHGYSYGKRNVEPKGDIGRFKYRCLGFVVMRIMHDGDIGLAMTSDGASCACLLT